MSNTEIRALLDQIQQACKQIGESLDDQPPHTSTTTRPTPPPSTPRQGVTPEFKSRCKWCGESISWQETVHGTPVALDREPGPYVLVDEIALFRRDREDGYRYHFAPDACPNNDYHRPKPPSPERKLLFEEMGEAIERKRAAEGKQDEALEKNNNG